MTSHNDLEGETPVTIIEDRLPAIESLTLTVGSHDAPTNGATDACVMEAVAWVAGEDWSDRPVCASPVIGAFLRAWNDTLADEPRQTLKAYVPRLVGSNGTPEQEDTRAWLAMDWLVRTYTPVWLRAAGLGEQADRIEGLPEFRAGMDVPSVRPAIDAVRKDAAAAWAAAWDAAGDAARDAAREAARAAAGDAARDAAWEAAGAAAWAAARAAARAAAWAAARAAARDALQPHVDTLQESAHTLVDRMLAVTEAQP